ncbi:MAG: hypothetical protein NVS2B9_00620 [Myxococcales bacterium]
MRISIWLPVLANAALLLFLLLQRTRAGSHDSGARLAALAGVRRAWGEGDASLRRRAAALSRWPYSTVAPEVAWWARLLNKLRKR